jgi:hypothetical protein
MATFGLKSAKEVNRSLMMNILLCRSGEKEEKINAAGHRTDKK